MDKTNKRVSASEFLRQIRADEGDVDTPESVVVDLRRGGFTLRVEADKLLVGGGEIDDALAGRVRAMKPAIVALLAGSKLQNETSIKWNADEADDLCELALHRLERFAYDHGRAYPALFSREERAKHWTLFDRIDLAYLSQNLAGVVDAVHALLALLDAFPKTDRGRGTWTEEAATLPLWTGWIRWRRKWYAAIRDVPDRLACSEMLRDAAESYQHCDTTVLANGQHPSRIEKGA